MIREEWNGMALESEDAIARAIGASSLGDLDEVQVAALAQRLGDIPKALQLHLIKTNPQLQDYALRAVAAVEDDLRTPLHAINENTREAFRALSETREILAGELAKPNLSDERWHYLIDTLSTSSAQAAAVTADTNRLIADQTTAARYSKLTIAAMPYIEVVLQAGIRLVISKGRA
jgi:hypothetical protein